MSAPATAASSAVRTSGAVPRSISATNAPSVSGPYDVHLMCPAARSAAGVMASSSSAVGTPGEGTRGRARRGRALPTLEDRLPLLHERLDALHVIVGLPQHGAAR